MSACVLCPIFHPSGQPRLPHFPPVCDSCRSRLASDLRELPDLYALLPSVMSPGSSGESTKVSGSRDAPVPPNLDVVDLLLPVRPGSVGVRMRFDARGLPGLRPQDPPQPVNWATEGGDPLQVGSLSVLTVLDFWARDWCEARDVGENPPTPVVASMAAWLSGERLRWACDSHPAIEEFADDIRRLVRVTRRLLNVAKVVFRLPVPCPSAECDRMALHREAGGEYIECGACGRLWTESEYQRLAVVAAADLLDGAA